MCNPVCKENSQWHGKSQITTENKRTSKKNESIYIQPVQIPTKKPPANEHAINMFSSKNTCTCTFSTRSSNTVFASTVNKVYVLLDYGTTY